MEALQPSEDAPPPADGRSATAIKRLVIRLAIFAVLWIVIAGIDPSSWIIGLPTVLFASWSSLRLSSDGSDNARLKLGGVMRYLPYFVIESVRGGVDVAARVLRPRVKIEPGFLRYQPRLANPTARVVFLDSISLLPGTLSADLRDGVIEVHALDVSADLTPGLLRLERLVGRLFGEELGEARR